MSRKAAPFLETDTHIYFWGSEFSNFKACKFTIDHVEYRTKG